MISIIVPVYNVEKYLYRCIDSILAQTYTDFELLLIDDGSKDKSGLICDEYAKKDSRIKVFHKENGGVSTARNIGLQYAQGEWLAFIDADDYVHFNFLASFESMISEDLGLIHWGFCYNTNGDIKTIPISDKDKIMTMDEVCRNKIFHGYVWSYLFRRDIIKENKILFDTHLKYAEDWLFILTYYSFVDKMGVLRSCYYTQVNRPGSATNIKLGHKYIQDNFTMYNKLLEIYSNQSSNRRHFLYDRLKDINVWMVNNVVYEQQAKCLATYKNSWKSLKLMSFKFNLLLFSPLFVRKWIYLRFVRIHKYFN